MQWTREKLSQEFPLISSASNQALQANGGDVFGGINGHNRYLVTEHHSSEGVLPSADMHTGPLKADIALLDSV